MGAAPGARSQTAARGSSLPGLPGRGWLGCGSLLLPAVPTLT